MNRIYLRVYGSKTMNYLQLCKNMYIVFYVGLSLSTDLTNMHTYMACTLYICIRYSKYHILYDVGMYVQNKISERRLKIKKKVYNFTYVGMYSKQYHPFYNLGNVKCYKLYMLLCDNSWNLKIRYTWIG